MLVKDRGTDKRTPAHCFCGEWYCILYHSICTIAYNTNGLTITGFDSKLIGLATHPPTTRPLSYTHTSTGTITMTTTREPCRRGRGRRRKGTTLFALLLVAATSTAAAAAAAAARHGPYITSTGVRSKSSSGGFVFPRLCQRQPRRAAGVGGECVSAWLCLVSHSLLVNPSACHLFPSLVSCRTMINSLFSSHPIAIGPLPAHRSGGGGGGKSSKEKRRDRGRGSGASSSFSSSSAAQSFSSSFSPPADADEMPMLYDKDGVETTGAMGNKPAQWPNKVRCVDALLFPSLSVMMVPVYVQLYSLCLPVGIFITFLRRSFDGMTHPSFLPSLLPPSLPPFFSRSSSHKS